MHSSSPGVQALLLSNRPSDTTIRRAVLDAQSSVEFAWPTTQLALALHDRLQPCMRRNNSSSNKLAAAEQGLPKKKMPKPQPWLVLLSPCVALAGALVAFVLIYTLSRQDEAKDNEETMRRPIKPALGPAPPFVGGLSLRNCGLTELPAAIGQCASLKKLDLGGNDLTDLPSSLAKCRARILFVLAADA